MERREGPKSQTVNASYQPVNSSLHLLGFFLSQVSLCCIKAGLKCQDFVFIGPKGFKVKRGSGKRNLFQLYLGFNQVVLNQWQFYSLKDFGNLETFLVVKTRRMLPASVG